TPESNFSSKVGIAETIAIGERAGLVPIVTHMKVQGHEQGTADARLADMQAATKRGAYTAADAYPYPAGQSSLRALIGAGWAEARRCCSALPIRRHARASSRNPNRR